LAKVGTSRSVDPSRFPEHPEEMVWQQRAVSLSMDPKEVERIQLAGVRKRFAELRSKIPALDSLATEQGIDEIKTLNDAAPLLFKHSIYKSYPISLIEKNRFDRLTAWLGKLTTCDLSGVKTEGVESIDDWLDAVRRDAGVRVMHTTGTSGKLSFLPRGPAEAARQVRYAYLPITRDGEEDPADLDQMPMILIGYRHMYNAYGAMIDSIVEELYDGDESMLNPLYPGRMSADMVSLGGRLSAADDRGDRSTISPSLLARREKFIEDQKQAPAQRRAFYDKVFDTLRGKRIMMAANWIMLYEMMEAGRERGLTGVFAPESRVTVSGGTKGKTLPEGYQEEIRKFLGVPRFFEGYGMSEMSTLMPQCSEGKFHALPWMIVYLLDPETGQPVPRKGTHTGRFGVIDLAQESRWGGVLSGDEVTMTFDTCKCGKSGPFVEPTIRRFSEKEGGDDKITCAGAPEAHDKALAFLTEME